MELTKGDTVEFTSGARKGQRFEVTSSYIALNGKPMITINATTGHTKYAAKLVKKI